MKNVTVDGITINTAHFARMNEADAIANMIKDGFVPGTTDAEKNEWGKKAYALIKAEASPTPAKEVKQVPGK